MSKVEREQDRPDLDEDLVLGALAEMEDGEEELTDEQLAQQDWVDNTIHNFLRELVVGRSLEWDIEPIAIVREAIMSYLCDDRKFYSRQEFYPEVLPKSVVIMASGYEWECLKCGDWNPVSECELTRLTEIACRRCRTRYTPNLPPEHSYD